MLEESIKTYIEINAWLNFNFIIDEHIGEIHCPTLNEIGDNFILYIYYVNNFIDLYEKDVDAFYSTIIQDEQKVQEFFILISYFKKHKNIFYQDSKFHMINYDDRYNSSNIDEITPEDLKINYIDSNNVKTFMETIAILHWRDDKTKRYKPANKIAEEMIKRANELKAEIQKKVKQKDGIGVLEIMSSVSARHPSINPTNIKELNYYQIIEQFNRLQMIDEFGRYSNAWSSGVLDKDGIKEMQNKHYINKIDSDK